MAVKVYDASTPETYEHADGENLDVHDGHLLVTAVRNAAVQRVAIYAPGKWERAEVTK